ncbi:MAG: glutamate--tRNA ligase [Candidatus Aenigmatarchaeota archaeon]
MNLEKIVLKHLILNALKYGKANEKIVISKIIAENKELKDKINEIKEIINQKIDEINNLSKEKLEELAKEFEIILEKKEEKEFELPFAEKGKVITAFPPEPSKYLHIGHAKAAFLNYYYAKKYDGKFILRFEDSNPEKVKREYYNAIRDDLKWLGIKWDEEDVLSLHLEEYYEALRLLILRDKAYACFCSKDKIKEYRAKGIECEHRNFSIEKNLKIFEDMLSGKYKENEVHIRAKIDMKHKNYVMRDPSLVRISFKEHPIVGNKYFVWPLYDFGTAMLDYWEKITHRFRSKEFELRTELQNWIREALGINKHPIIIEIARFEIKDQLTSGRKIRELIQKGILSDYDDIRLVTIRALKKRGFLPNAILDFVKRTGISKSESKIEIEVLESINRQHLDKYANRYFFVDNPKRLKVINATTKFARIKFHPDFEDRGYREILTKGDFFISESDFKDLKEGDEVRLIDLYNIKIIQKNENEIIAEKIGEELIKDIKKIHWISLNDDFVKVKVIKAEKLIENGKINENSLREIFGYGESTIKRILIGERVQFVRFGFVKLESIKENLYEFIFIHK